MEKDIRQDDTINYFPEIFYCMFSDLKKLASLEERSKMKGRKLRCPDLVDGSPPPSGVRVALLVQRQLVHKRRLKPEKVGVRFRSPDCKYIFRV
jgi:hypothetical protein